MSNNIARRGKILIEPYAQLRFGLVFLMVNLLFSVILLSVFTYYLWDVYVALTSYFTLTNRELVITWQKFQTPFFTSLFVLVIFIVTSLVVSARYTHQIYGPLVSINRFVDQLIAGKVPEKIRLREGDQLGSLVDRLNLLVVPNCREQVLDALTALEQGTPPKLIDFTEKDPYRDLATKINAISSARSG
ncbi:MAG: hypothetical protein OXT67_06735 [Zetaproteobacteria bacterium]|nr:hypothetical protein [Zetaproteobacteria bacterium]